MVLKILLRKLSEYFQAHNYDITMYHKFDMYGVLYITISYKKVETVLYFNRSQINDKVRNMTYEQFEKYVEKTALKCLYDTTK